MNDLDYTLSLLRDAREALYKQRIGASREVQQATEQVVEAIALLEKEKAK